MAVSSSHGPESGAVERALEGTASDPSFPRGAIYDLEVPVDSDSPLQELEADDQPRQLRLGGRRSWRERLFSLPWRPWRAWKEGSVEVKAAVIGRSEGPKYVVLRLVILEKPRRLA